MRTSRCRSCDEEIIWTETEKGKKMPVDAEPSGIAGTFRLEDRGPDQPPLALYCVEGSEPDLYTSHFATCKDADRWRKPAPKAPEGDRK